MPPKSNNVRNPPGQGKSRSARRRRARRAKASSGAAPAPRAKAPQKPAVDVFSERYANLLNDPFSNEPMKLGFGTLVDTRIGMARITATIGSNATDGSLLLAVKPNAQNPLGHSTVVTGNAPAWNAFTDSSWTTATAEFESARPIALGLRIAPVTAATTVASRVVFCLPAYDATDDIPGTRVANLNGTTHASWYSSHLGSKCLLASGGSQTAMYTWRPMSLRNFEFDDCWLSQDPATSGTTTFPICGPVIVAAITGAASAQYDVEVLYYYEALGSVTAMSPGTSVLADQSPADFFPSFEKFYRSASQYMTAQNVGHIVGSASTGISYWQKYVSPLMPLMHLSSANVAQDDAKQEHEEDKLQAGLDVLRQSKIPKYRRAI